jgi:hypothetical protein
MVQIKRDRTNAFSKKVENHAHSAALFAMYYNSFVSTSREQPHPAVALAGEQPVAVVLDFVNPLRSGRRLCRSGGMQGSCRHVANFARANRSDHEIGNP